MLCRQKESWPRDLLFQEERCNGAKKDDSIGTIYFLTRNSFKTSVWLRSRQINEDL